MDVRNPTPDDVSRYYDTMTDFYHIMWGESLHLGYWPDPAADLDIEAAQECYTDLMIRHMPLQPGQRMLDVGCGTGQPAVRLARATGCSVVGITINQMQIERANARAQAAGVSDRVQFEYADAMELPYADGSFDAVWALESIFHMPDRAQVLREMVRVIRPGGQILIADVVEEVPLTAEERRVFFAAVEATSLTTREHYRHLLESAGGRVAEIIDITTSTVNTLQKTVVMLEQEHKQAQLLQVFDAEIVTAMLPLWHQIVNIYENKIGYIVLPATRVE
jgi:ubiquinone/menaquinone biosynthesis C-methylase UbiE